MDYNKIYIGKSKKLYIKINKLTLIIFYILSLLLMSFFIKLIGKGNNYKKPEDDFSLFDFIYMPELRNDAIHINKKFNLKDVDNTLSLLFVLRHDFKLITDMNFRVMYDITYSDSLKDIDSTLFLSNYSINDSLYQYNKYYLDLSKRFNCKISTIKKIIPYYKKIVNKREQNIYKKNFGETLKVVNKHIIFE